MTVEVRPYECGGWEFDIMLTIPCRPRIRDRNKAPVSTKSAAQRWGEARERQLIQHHTNTDPSNGGDDSRPDVTTTDVPTWAKFLPRNMEGHSQANRLRPALLDQRERSLRVHLVPAFGRGRLDRITAEDIQKCKGARSHSKHSTVNLHHEHLCSLLTIALEWGVIDRLPTRINELKEGTPDFGPAHPAAFVLLAPGDEGHARSGDPGASRAPETHDDAAMHAPRSNSSEGCLRRPPS